jgi:aminoglycoside phosphotransferase (APT) family kinase protein
VSGALPLRGSHRSLEAVRAGLQGVPGVLVHGDVGSGLNILVDGPDYAVIDWETSAEGELPLTDVLPLICLRLADQHGHDEPHAVADYVLRLCAGREADSSWLFDLVLRYCARVGVPSSQAGRLAVLSWGHLASMRVVHEELVTAAGDSVTPWVSPADEIAQRWALEPDLGFNWRALVPGG